MKKLGKIQTFLAIVINYAVESDSRPQYTPISPAQDRHPAKLRLELCKKIYVRSWRSGHGCEICASFYVIHLCMRKQGSLEMLGAFDKIKGNKRAALASWLLTGRNIRENYGDLKLPHSLL